MGDKDTQPANGAPNMGNMGAFDFSALHGVLNDPNIKQMAEQIAQNPAFAQMSQALQASMAEGGGGLGGAGAAPPLDPEQYAKAMTSVLGNPQFMEMAEKLGQQIMTQDPSMAKMLENMQNPTFRDDIGHKMEDLKKDPEIKGVLDEIEKGGPAVMMKYWNDPAVLEKLSAAMGPDFQGFGGAEGQDGEEEGESEEDEEIAGVHDAASRGEAEALKELLEGGANLNEQDEEGRTALHFACGYGEMECAQVLIDHKADVNLVDNNGNTALHYAAGYGQADTVELLLKSGCKEEAQNADKKTALEVAELNDQKEIAALFSKK